MSNLSRFFSDIQKLESISVQLLKIEKSTDESIEYRSREIELYPESFYEEYLSGLCNKYTTGNYSENDPEPYQGDVVNGTIYELSVFDDLINESLKILEKTIADPIKEKDVIKKEWDALLIKGILPETDQNVPVRLISMKTPVSVMKNRFLLDDQGRFRKIENHVLTLNNSLDAVLFGETFYFMTMQAEKLFDIERAYKIKCDRKTREIIDSGLISNNDKFSLTAKKGVNPRRFVSYNPQRFEALQKESTRKKLLKMFQIEVNQDGKINTDDEVSSDRLIRFLCNKAMLDPVDEGPREVSAAKAWK